MQEISGPLVILLSLGAFGITAYQVWSGTYSRKLPGDSYSTTIRRSEEPVRWFASTMGWFVVGLGSLAFFVVPKLMKR